MRYRLKIVKTYNGAVPVFYGTGILSDYELQPIDLMQQSRAIQYSTNVYQARADFFRVGKLTLSLNAMLAKWVPRVGWLQYDKDHILTVTTDSGMIVWMGFATGVQHKGDASAEWAFSSMYDRLDDIEVRGDADPDREAVTAWSILAEVRAQLPDLWPAFDASSWRPVYRPTRDTSGRDYVAAMLTAEGHVLLPDAVGGLEIRPITPRTAAFDAATDLIVRSEDLLSLRVLDDKQYMYNTVTFTAHDGEKMTYHGELEEYRPPGSYIYRWGRREVEMSLDHLSGEHGYAIADEWQERLVRPRRRVVIGIPDPDRFVLLLERVRLELDDIADIRAPLWGDFIVSGVKINVVTDSIELELEEILPDLALPALALPDLFIWPSAELAEREQIIGVRLTAPPIGAAMVSLTADPESIPVPEKPLTFTRNNWWHFQFLSIAIDGQIFDAVLTLTARGGGVNASTLVFFGAVPIVLTAPVATVLGTDSIRWDWTVGAVALVAPVATVLGSDSIRWNW